MIRRLALVIALLVGVKASATTYYVAQNDTVPTDPVNGLCAHNGLGGHTSVGSGFAASGANPTARCAASVTAGCTAAQPCCTVMAAVAKATSSGDIIDVHLGTFKESANTNLGDYSSSTQQDFTVVLNVAGVTLRGAPGDSCVAGVGVSSVACPIIDGSGLGQGAAKGIVQMRKSNTTVKGLTLQSHAVSNNDNDRTGCVFGLADSGSRTCVSGSSVGSACTVDSPDCPGNGQCGLYNLTVTDNIIHCDGSNTSLSSNTGVRMVSVDNFEVGRNTIDGTFNEGMYFEGTEGLVGAHVHHNKVTQSLVPTATCHFGGAACLRDSLCPVHSPSNYCEPHGGYRGIEVEALGQTAVGDATNASQPGQLLIHDDIWTKTGATPDPDGMTTMAYYLRELHWKLRMWNEIVVGYQVCARMQDDVPNKCSEQTTPKFPGQFHIEDHRVFNNTCVAATNPVGPRALFWPSRSQAYLTNNIIKGFPTIARMQDPDQNNAVHADCCPGQATPVGTGSPNSCGATFQWASNTGHCCPKRDLNESGLIFGYDLPRQGFVNNSVLFGCDGTGCGGTGFYESTDDPLVTRVNNVTGDPLLTASYHLQAGSPAIGKGVTNPLCGTNGGSCTAGDCSLTFRGQAVPCNLDADGVTRTAARWDAGAYQLSDTTPPTDITGLNTTRRTPTAVRLTWTAPSDNIGVTSYDVRYAETANCTGFNYDTATTMTGETTPLAAGQIENMFVPTLTPNTAYCFGIKSSDAIGNTQTTPVTFAASSAPINNDLPILKGLHRGGGTHFTVEGNAHGTATETTLTTTRPLAFDAAQLLLQGDVEGATITISLRESRFLPGEADLFSASGVVSNGRFAVNDSAVGNVTKHNRLSLPPGNYILRVASSSSSSRGEVSGEISILKR